LPPVVDVASEILQQFLECPEAVVLFTLPDVPVVTLAALVVIPYAANSAGAVVQAVLVPVSTGWQWLRQLPDRDFNDRPVVANLLGASEQDRRHVLHGSNTGVLCLPVRPFEVSAICGTLQAWRRRSDSMKQEHIGSDFDDFLREENLLADSEATAAKRVVAFQIAQEMKRRKLTKSETASRMKTSVSRL
jgi:hypothetical protein